ncbi:MAG: carboxypeptidase-like regulatory domain-containing protein [Acidobacteria bacterium]|nr:carboxypeptidase-like regulatory domain-containing protein [Acidobacteriota bacterium]
MLTTSTRRSWSVLVAVAVLAALPCQQAGAQTITGSISGTVVDPSGAVVPGVEVTLVNELTGETRRTATSDNGELVFTALPPGTYRVKIEKEGFRGFERTGIVLTASVRLPLGRIQLSVGEVRETVTVSMAGETVNTESPDVTGLLSSQQLNSLIVRGRDPMSLLRTLPGTTTGTFVNGGERSDTDSSSQNSNGGQFGSLTFSMNGSRLWWNTAQVDGQVHSNPDWPGLFMSAVSVESVAELKVVANNYSAEYGRNLGPTISVVTKSGSRDFHGNLSFYKRHEQFNANDFFNNRNGLPKPLYRYTTGSGSVGGPVYVPNRFNASKEKLFFFYSQEEWRVKTPQAILFLTVPTQAERAGDFSQTLDQAGRLIPIIDPLTRQQFPGNIIPSNRINPNGQALLNMIPQANQLNRNLTLGAYNYQWQEPCELPKRLQALKTDYIPNRQDRISLSLRRWWADSRAYTGCSFGYGSLPVLQHHFLYTTDNAQLSWTRIFGPAAVNEFNIGVVGEKERGIVPGPWPERATTYFDTVTRSKLGYRVGQFFPQANPFGLIPQATYGGVPNPGNVTHDARLPLDQGYSRFNFSDRFSLIRGSHTLKFGLDYDQNWAHDGPSSACGNGCFNFGRDPNNPGDANWAYATALLGNFLSYQETNNRPRYRYLKKTWEWFAQDTWKATRKLTLSYGVRFAAYTNWDLEIGVGAAFVPERYDRTKVAPLFRPARDAQGRRVAQHPVTGQFFPTAYIGAFVPDVGTLYQGTALSTDPSYPGSFQTGEPVQASPRFGFAYDLFGDGKTAIRGGFGVNKLTNPTYGGASGRTIFNAPSQLNPQIFYGNMDTLLSSASVQFPGNTGAFERDFKTPSAYNFSLGIQREIGFNTVLDVSYVGNLARHLLQTVNVNTIPFGARFLPQNIDPTTGTALPDAFLRPSPGYQNITFREYSGTSNYNSLQVTANRRFVRGVQLGVSYTWAKTMATGSNEGELLPLYVPRRVWSYGPTSFDQTQMLIINYVWELPKVSKVMSGPVVRHVLDGWFVSGVTSFASGFPRFVGFQTTDNADITGGGDGSRALMVARAHLPRGERTFTRWFNTEAFARPPRGNYGDAPIAPVRAPGVNNWDLVVTKQIPLGKESRNLEFRWELYNALNHTQFSQIDTTARFDPAGRQVNGRFGQVIATRLPRIMQFGLKFDF